MVQLTLVLPLFKRPLLYTDTKKKAGRGGRRVQTEPQEPDPDEANLPNDEAAPVKARVRPTQKAKKGQCEQ